MVMSSRPLGRSSQRGMVLILIAFIIGLGAAAFMYKMFNASNLQVAQDEKTMRVLGEAKAALIAWAVSHPNSPGMMPWPDRNTDTDFDGDSAYDGKSDCATTAFQPSYLLGQLPWRAQSNPCVMPHTGLGADFRDAQGNRLWYAVSRNMVRDYEHSEYPIINPGMANPPHAVTPYLRQGGTDSYPWLRVLDRNGNLLSDRVAAVIIAPGNPLEEQDRSSSAPDASQYLDKLTIGGNTFKNYDSALVDEDFIMGEDSKNLSASDSTYVRPYRFNDKLVYITIDELIVAVEARATNTLKNSLLNYYEPASGDRPNGRGIGYFPYAASLGSSKDYVCITSNTAGVLPISDISPPNFTCSYNRSGTPRITSVSCTTGFTNLNSIQFERNANDFNASTGACSFNGRVCTCKGAGSCSRITATTQAFSCDVAGNCLTSATTGSLNGTVTFSGGEFTSRNSRCSLACADAVCSGNGAGSASRANTCNDAIFNTGSSSLPTWIMTNKWYDYFYYASSRNGIKLTSGSKVNIDSLLIGTGRSIIAPNSAVSKGASQLRPSCAVNDYLDSIENTNANQIFDGQSITRTPNYNDHTYIVAP